MPQGFPLKQNIFCRNKISPKLNGKIEIYFAEISKTKWQKDFFSLVHSEIV
jgi:hypothetical protein